MPGQGKTCLAHPLLCCDCAVTVLCTGTRGMGIRLVDFGGSFGVSETDTQRLSCEVQTLQYRAPEVLLFCGVSHGALVMDWVIIGLVCYILVRGSRILHGCMLVHGTDTGCRA